MAAYKNINKKWMVTYSYYDWTGRYVRTSKRGFKTKKDAQEWYEDFNLNKKRELTMSFSSLVETYLEDMSHRLKKNTMLTKKLLINKKILPFFEKKVIREITAVDIRKWQAFLLSKNFSDTYLRTIHNQLSAIFNYAVRFYDLKYNPCTRAGSIGSKSSDEKLFWTVKEFNTFIESMSDNIDAYIGFMLLFWTGMRIGELLALNVKDFDFNSNTVTISKSYQSIKGKDIITSPKTKKSKRVVGLPDFLVDDLKDYFARLYEVEARERIFPYTKYFFENKLKRGCKATGVKKIRIHDLRHSHASLLVNTGLSVKAIADRLGHERVETTLNTYSHLYKATQDEIVSKLEILGNENKR